MKISRSILPIAALVLAGAWLISQRQAISVVKQTNTQLQKNITAARSSSPSAVIVPVKPTSRVKAQPPVDAKQANEPLDWKKIAAQCEALQQNYDAKEMERLRQRFEKLSVAELIAALEKVATLGLSASSHKLLMDSLLMPLVAKDPEAALTGYMDFLGDNTFGTGWQLADVTKKWAEKDPARAAAWFAEQVAAGRFESKSVDGENRIREKIEYGFFSASLDTDPAAAARSLAAMAEERRTEVLSDYLDTGIKQEKQLDFITLLRSHLSAKNQARLLSRKSHYLARSGGYAEVEAFMEQISATPTERVACVGEAARQQFSLISKDHKVTRADIDAMRVWTQAQAPGATDTTTGIVIASSIGKGGGMSFADAAELTLQYHKASGNDDTLIAFLHYFPGRINREVARGLTAQISDPKSREEILKNLE